MRLYLIFWIKHTSATYVHKVRYNLISNYSQKAKEKKSPWSDKNKKPNKFE